MYVVRKTGYVIKDSINPKHALKSFSDTPEEYADLLQLQYALESILNQMISGFEKANPVPTQLLTIFSTEMNRVKTSLSNDLTEQYRQALDDGASPDAALEIAGDVLLGGFERLSRMLCRYEREIQVLRVFQYHTEQGYVNYLFLCEKGANSCERCQSYHGKLMGADELFSRHLVPPLHPNCRCELVVMDYMAAMLYNRDKEVFLSTLETALDRSEGQGRGGIYLLDAPYARILLGSIPPELIERLTDRHGDILADLSKPFGYEKPFSLPNPLEELKGLIALYRAAQEYRSAHKWDSFGAFLDWLTGGIPVGLWNSVVGRWDAVVENPSLYTVLNFITLGTSGMVAGAVEPEGPFSLQHWLDMLGTALLVYGLYQRAKSAMGFADDIAGSISRPNTGLSQSQIDDILALNPGNRPNPSTYLTQAYISNHLSYFRNGVTKIIDYVPSGKIGPPSGTFVFPTALVDDLIRQAAGDISKLEELLGLPAGSLGSNPVRVDIPNPTGLRMPSGNEPGANEFWLPGGYTKGGIMEAIIDQVNPGQYSIKPIN